MCAGTNANQQIKNLIANVNKHGFQTKIAILNSIFRRMNGIIHILLALEAFSGLRL